MYRAPYDVKKNLLPVHREIKIDELVVTHTNMHTYTHTTKIYSKHVHRDS